MRRPFPRLLVLVPHRDVRLPMRAWSGSLFAAGLQGAWSFPWVVPLATLDRKLSDGELKSLSRALREHSRTSGGKFTAGPTALAPLPFFPKAFAFGPSLDIAIPAEPEGPPPIKPISPAVLGSALLYAPPPDGLPDPPQIAFQASALAVMRFRPLSPGNGHDDDYSFKWEIGKLHWLPK